MARTKGSTNKRAQENLRIAKRKGKTPLEYLLDVMNQDLPEDEDKKPAILAQKLDAAKAAAPYVHARLASVEMKAEIIRDIRDITDTELAAIATGGGKGAAQEAESQDQLH